MNNRPTLIAVICGLLTAWLFLGQFMLGGLGIFLATFTALPLFVAVLGFGTTAGLISGAIAAGIVALVSGLAGAGLVILFTLGPALWIGHMAGLSRNDTGVDEWFPLSTIIFRMSIMCAGISLLIGLATGFSAEVLAQDITKIMQSFVEGQSRAAGVAPMLNADEIAARSLAMANIIPIAFPASLFFLMSINLLLAERFVRKRGWILRPKEYYPLAIAMPPVAVAILIAAAIASFASGPLGQAAQVVAGAFGAGFVAVGLATIHHVSMGRPARPFFLPLAYIALFASQIMAPVFAVLGVAETLFQLRTRASSGPKST